MATTKKAPPKDAIALLKEDHTKVRALLETLEKSGDGKAERRVALLQKIEKELEIHTTIEEEIFYPAYREKAESKDDRLLVHEANEEHGVVKMYLPEMHKGDLAAEKFTAKAKVLKELVEHHAKEEEKEMFKSARKLFSKDELRDLGGRMATRKRQLQRGV
jgi:hemerythrin-like domain-containing protein